MVFSSNKLYKIYMESFKEKINFIKSSLKERKEFLEDKNIKLTYDEIQLLIYFFDKIELIYKDIEEEIKREKELNIKSIGLLDGEYPQNLKNIKLPPYMIYVMGNWKEIYKENSLGLVGTRYPEDYFAKKIMDEISNELVKNNWNGIGGLAKGCDTYGHEGMLKFGGVTGGILGNGFGGDIFPEENKELFYRILDKGGYFLTELPYGSLTKGCYLLGRNRLQGTLGKGIFVGETGIKGGTITTIKSTLAENKYVFIWNPKNKNLENFLNVQGNFKIINGEKDMGIGIKDMKKIISVEDPREILEIIKKEENKKLSSSLLTLF
ncbi:MAG: DNA-processing protein DprA [Cetobacterium sp.]